MHSPSLSHLAAALALLGIPCCDPQSAKQAGALATIVDVAACGVLEAVVDPGPTHDEIGHVCAASRPLIQGIVDALGALHAMHAAEQDAPAIAVCEAGGEGGEGGASSSTSRRSARHPVRRRGRTIGHLRADWAARVQAALDMAADTADAGADATDAGDAGAP